MDRRQDEKITELQLLLDLTTDFRDRLSDSDEDYQHQLASQRIIISILIAVAPAAMATAGVMVVRSRKKRQKASIGERQIVDVESKSFSSDEWLSIA